MRFTYSSESLESSGLSRGLARQVVALVECMVFKAMCSTNPHHAAKL